MILVCGGLADTVTELVCARLSDCDYPYRFVDLSQYPGEFRIKWHWQGAGVDGYIAGPGWKTNLDDLTGVYIRFIGSEARLPPAGLAPESAPAIYFEHDTGLMALLEDLQCAVVNRTAGGISNGSKLYQALLVRSAGLLTPTTLVTNNPEAVRRFHDEHEGALIYKSLSGTRSVVRRLDSKQLGRLPLLRNGPAQFQEFIPGRNIRVHTVGDQIFATSVHSDAVDYRYAHREGLRVEMEPTLLPPAIESACLSLAHQLDLILAGIDLKVTPDGDYYCFEVNPCPGFLYYEKHGGQAISLALANLLYSGSEYPTVEKGACPRR